MVCTSLLHIYHITKAIQAMKIPTGVGSIMAVDTLTHCALFHSVCDLKVALMNMQRSLIWELMLYEFELGYNAAEVIKDICYPKGKSSVNHSNHH